MSTDKQINLILEKARMNVRHSGLDFNEAILAAIPLAELLALVRAASLECSTFRFPDEDRPELHAALEALKKKGIL